MKAKDIISLLDLEEYSMATIQKVIGGSIDIYVISIDSRYPLKHIPYKLLKKSISTQMYRNKQNSLKRVLLTPPVLLNRFNGKISGNAYVFVRDLGREYLLNPSRNIL